MATSPRRPGQRAGLDRDAVFSAARELLAEGGSSAVTIRAVARKLQIAPNALYSYVPSRTALLDRLLDELLANVAAPPADSEDPLAAVHALMSSTYDVLTAAPDLVPLYLTRQGARGPNAVRLGQTMDRLLERAGVASNAVAEARRMLIVHTIGAAAFATAPAMGDSEQPLTIAQIRPSFARSLTWLLTGIAYGAQATSTPGGRPRSDTEVHQ
jgi:TetR/AcrR family transcriptional regulator, tetracycline repressor protein